MKRKTGKSKKSITEDLSFKKFIYSPYLTGEEKEILDQMDEVNLDHEVKLLRLRIVRLLKFEAQSVGLDPSKINPEKDPAMILEEYEKAKSDQFGAAIKHTWKRRQFDYLLMSYIGRLAALEKTRMEIKANGEGGGTEDRARDVVNFIAGIKALQKAEKPNDSE